MQTQYFIKQLENLLSKNEIELSISLLRKFTKFCNQALYARIVKLSAVQQHFKKIEFNSHITPSERIRFQHAATRELLEILAHLENSLPIHLPQELAELAQHLLGAIQGRENREHAASFASEEKIEEAKAVQLPAVLEAIPAGRPIRLSVAGMFGYALILFILGAIAPGIHLLSQQWGAEELSLFETHISQEEIADLALYYDLTEIEAPNHHLSFDQAVLAYWQGRMAEGMEAQKLETAFATFKAVIQQAQEEKREILTHQDLYMLARSQIDKGLYSQRSSN